MCGRYVATAPTGVLAEQFSIDEVREPPPEPSWNVAPTDPVPAVVERRERRLLGTFRWGLVPSWAKDASGAARRINARAETIRDKPAFRSAFLRRRCLLPAQGFYEWEKRPDGTKRAWFISRTDGAPMAMAAVWEVWRPAEDDLLRTCAVVTTEANHMMAPVHKRMPVMIESEDWAAWLDPSVQDELRLSTLLVPAPDGVLERFPVAPLVNSVKNDGPELIEPAEPTLEDPAGVVR